MPTIYEYVVETLDSGDDPERMETCDGAEDGPPVPKRFRTIVFPIGEK